MWVFNLHLKRRATMPQLSGGIDAYVSVNTVIDIWAELNWTHGTHRIFSYSNHHISFSLSSFWVYGQTSVSWRRLTSGCGCAGTAECITQKCPGAEVLCCADKIEIDVSGYSLKVVKGRECTWLVKESREQWRRHTRWVGCVHTPCQENT